MTAFTIEVNDAALKAVLQRLSNLEQGPLNAVLFDVGEGIMARTKQRFVTSTAPDGTPWKPLAQATYNALADRLGKSSYQKDGRLNAKGASKIANKKILVGGSKDLSSRIVIQSGNGSVTVGSAMIYAAIQQFGGITKAHEILPKNKKALAFGGGVYKKVNHPGSNIPARPFLPVTKDGQLYPQERQTILHELNELLQAQIFAK